jgi:hypothetical protein
MCRTAADPAQLGGMGASRLGSLFDRMIDVLCANSASFGLCANSDLDWLNVAGVSSGQVEAASRRRWPVSVALLTKPPGGFRGEVSEAS